MSVLFASNSSARLSLFAPGSRFYWCDDESESIDEHNYNKGRNTDLLQGLGLRPTNRLQPEPAGFYQIVTEGHYVDMMMTIMIVVTAAVILSSASWHDYE
jgi:hypothetical protein